MDPVILKNRLKSETEREELDLSAEDLGAGGAEIVAAALKEATNALKTLLMEECQIGDAGASALAEAIKVNTSLTKLSLFGNDKITDAGKFALAAALNVNTTLTDYDGPGDDQIAPAEERAANRQKYLASLPPPPAPEEERPKAPTGSDKAPATGCCVIA